jgi:hypothetical protein
MSTPCRREPGRKAITCSLGDVCELRVKLR